MCARGQHSRSKGYFKVKYEFARVKVGTSAILLFHVINTSKCIFYIIYIIKGFLKRSKVIFKVKQAKI